MASKTWRIRAVTPFLVAGVHHDATGEDGAALEYDFAEDIAAQIVAAGRAVRVPDSDPAA